MTPQQQKRGLLGQLPFCHSVGLSPTLAHCRCPSTEFARVPARHHASHPLGVPRPHARARGGLSVALSSQAPLRSICPRQVLNITLSDAADALKFSEIREMVNDMLQVRVRRNDCSTLCSSVRPGAQEVKFKQAALESCEEGSSQQVNTLERGVATYVSPDYYRLVTLYFVPRFMSVVWCVQSPLRTSSSNPTTRAYSR